MENKVQSTTPKRVKVYTLEGDKWIDRGTGYCSGEIDGGPHFIVRNENDSKDTLLITAIEGTTQFQRQQDTLIVWTDAEGNDYALSFQEPEGCLSLCDFLVEIQRSIEPNISLVAVTSNGQDGEISEVIAGPVPEPVLPNNDNLAEVAELLNQGSKSNKFRELLLDYINNKDYLQLLLKLFEKSETEKNLPNLYYLCDIVKTLVFYNETSILDFFVEDDLIMGIIGILEYDPEFPDFKSSNREYLTKKTKFKEVIPIKNQEIKMTLKKTFRLYFLKDVVLARLLDDIAFNCISTMIHINEDKVLKFLKDDKSFLKQLFNLYNDSNDNSKNIQERRRESIKLIHQFTLTAKKFQPIPRSEFYRSLLEKGLFKLIKFAFQDDIVESRVLATELIVTIIEDDALLFNKNNHQEQQENSLDSMLIEILTNVLINEKNIGLKTQAFEALKVLLDPTNIAPPSSPLDASPSSIEFHEDSSTNSFLTGFYEASAFNLFKPLSNVDQLKPCKVDKNLIISYSNLCELLSFISKEHDKLLSRSFILENHLLVGVSKLMSDKFGVQLRLSALRCIKAIIYLDDEFYTRYIIQNDILKNFILLLEETNDANNLINSTCLSLLSTISQNDSFMNYKLLRDYLSDSYESILKKNFLGVELLNSKKRQDEENELRLKAMKRKLSSKTEDDEDAQAGGSDDTYNNSSSGAEISLTSPDVPEHDDDDDDEDGNNSMLVESPIPATLSNKKRFSSGDNSITASVSPILEKRIRQEESSDENDETTISPGKRKKLNGIMSRAGKILGISATSTTHTNNYNRSSDAKKA